MVTATLLTQAGHRVRERPWPITRFGSRRCRSRAQNDRLTIHHFERSCWDRALPGGRTFASTGAPETPFGGAEHLGDGCQIATEEAAYGENNHRQRSHRGDPL